MNAESSEAVEPNADSTGYVESYRRAFEIFLPIEESRDGDTLHVKRAFRGVTLERAIGYPKSLGGTRTGEATVEGPGWRATLSAERVPVGPSYRLTEVTVDWTGEADVLDDVILHFRVKTFRAPG